MNDDVFTAAATTDSAAMWRVFCNKHGEPIRDGKLWLFPDGAQIFVDVSRQAHFREPSTMSRLEVMQTKREFLYHSITIAEQDFHASKAAFDLDRARAMKQRVRSLHQQLDIVEGELERHPEVIAERRAEADRRRREELVASAQRSQAIACQRELNSLQLDD